METTVKWDRECPGLKKKEKDGKTVLEITHSHPRAICYRTYGTFDRAARRELREVIDQCCTELAGCITFFKQYVSDERASLAERAAAASIVAADEARLKEFRSHRPHLCVIS